MERAVDDHDVAFGTRLARELDRGLVGLGPGVAEEGLAAEAAAGEAVGEAHGGLGVEEVADVQQPSRLLAHGGDNPGVAVADVRDGDAGEEVQVLVPVDVPEHGARAAHKLDGEAGVRGKQARRLEGL